MLTTPVGHSRSRCESTISRNSGNPKHMPSAGMKKGDGRATCEWVRISGSERASERVSEEIERTRARDEKRARVRDSSERRSSLETREKDGNERAQVVTYIPFWTPSRWKTVLHARASTMALR